MSDFYNEEYEKLQQEEQLRKSAEGWYNSQPTQPQPQRNKPLAVVIVCIALVVVFAIGWLFGLISGGKSSSEDVANAEIYNTVMEYIKQYYYKDISDEEWEQAIATSGTALMKGIGDKYGMLLTPQEFYDLLYPVDPMTDGSFGIGYTLIDNLGMSISSVYTDSSSYGVLQSGDIITYISNITPVSGQTVTDNGTTYSEINPGKFDSDTLQALLLKIKKATFTVLRNNSFVEVTIERGLVGNKKSDLHFVEYYFDNEHNNISYENANLAKDNTYNLRKLSLLPEGVGYVRLTEYSDGTFAKADGNGTVYTEANREFAQVMAIFKELGLSKLIFDLKGNPGGYINYACDIVSYMITDAGLTEQEKTSVVHNNMLKVVSLKAKDGLIMDLTTMSNVENMYRYGSYETYFGEYDADSPCKIVIWTDGNSASASELTTGALLDYKTAYQIGSKTFGKGIAQTVLPLEDFTGKVVDTNGNEITSFNYNGQTINCTWALYFTIEHYFSPLGTNIHGTGYTPNSDYLADSYDELWQQTYKYWQIQ